MIAAGLLFLVLAILGRSVSVSSLSTPASFLAFMLACVAVLWSHELGHILFALLAGMKVGGVNLWPYYLDLNKGPRWHVRTLGEWFYGRNLALKNREGARGKLLISVLGGWLASAGLILAAYLLLAPYQWRGESSWSLSTPDVGLWTYIWIRFLNFTKLPGAGFLIFQMLPLREMSSIWDGALAIDLLRGGESTRRAVNQYAFRSEAAEKRPRDWDQELLAECREDKPMIDRLNWIFLNYRYCLDKDDLEGARVWVDLGIETWNANRSLDANILRAERVYLYLRLKVDGFDYDDVFGDLAYPNHWWFSWNRAKIGMLLREGDVDEAMYYASGGINSLKGYEDDPVYALEADLFTRCLEECVAAFKEKAAEVAPDA